MADEIRPDAESAGCEHVPANLLQAPDEVQLRREARRRILAGGLAGAPLVLTLSSRSAFANHCSTSGMDSGNMSRDHDVVCLGLPPDAWRTDVERVSKYIFPGTCNPITDDGLACNDYSRPSAADLEAYIQELRQDELGNAEKIAAAEEYLENLGIHPEPQEFFGTLFSTVFPTVLTDDPYITMMQALFEDAGNSSPVLAHSAAAWLNANEFQKEAYGLSPDEVVDLVQIQISLDPAALLATLQELNTRGG